MKEYIASDIMIPISQYPVVSYTDTLRTAIREMNQAQFELNGIKSLPRVVLVFDETIHLIGVIRRRDLFRGLEPGFLVNSYSSYKRKWFDIKIDYNLSEVTHESFINSIKEKANRPVRDIMLPVAATVEYDDHLMKIISEMVQENVSMLPVLKHGKVLGVVRSVDLLNLIDCNLNYDAKDLLGDHSS